MPCCADRGCRPPSSYRSLLPPPPVSPHQPSARWSPEALRKALSDQNHYQPDAHFITDHGVPWWVERYSHLHPVSVQNRTHPPGALVLWNWLHGQLGPSRLGATVVAILTLSMAVPAWQLGRLLDGERAGRLAALPLLSAPAPLLFAFSNMDGVYGLLLSAGGTVLLTAIVARSATLAAVGGFALGLALFVTCAAGFLALAGALAEWPLLKSWRQTVRVLGAAAAGGCAALLGLQLVVGFNLIAANGTVQRIGYEPRPLWYWIAGGTPAVYLLFTGLAMASLGLLGMTTQRPPMSLALFAILLVMAALPRTITGLYPGEIERTWLFTVPFFAAPAGAALGDWERATPAIARAVLPILLTLAVGSAILIQAGYGVPDQPT